MTKGSFCIKQLGSAVNAVENLVNLGLILERIIVILQIR